MINRVILLFINVNTPTNTAQYTVCIIDPYNDAYEKSS